MKEKRMRESKRGKKKKDVFASLQYRQIDLFVGILPYLVIGSVLVFINYGKSGYNELESKLGCVIC